ncbi:MAG: hypothetical protein KGL52_03485, partial [Rhodospirillales bacterium]|nr:hypothetical protein [Rhodospirillales bacterium]
ARRAVRARGLARRAAPGAGGDRADPDAPPARPRRAAALAIAFGHPAHDAMYLAVAECFGRPFVTADARLARKLEGRAPAVLLLGDFAG